MIVIIVLRIVCIIVIVIVCQVPCQGVLVGGLTSIYSLRRAVMLCIDRSIINGVIVLIEVLVLVGCIGGRYSRCNRLHG